MDDNLAIETEWLAIQLYRFVSKYNWRFNYFFGLQPQKAIFGIVSILSFIGILIIYLLLMYFVQFQPSEKLFQPFIIAIALPFCFYGYVLASATDFFDEILKLIIIFSNVMAFVTNTELLCKMPIESSFLPYKIGSIVLICINIAHIYYFIWLFTLSFVFSLFVFEFLYRLLFCKMKRVVNSKVPLPQLLYLLFQSKHRGVLYIHGMCNTKQCIICLEDFMEGQSVVTLSCDKEHIFHNDCLEQWKQNNYTCPLCRATIINRRIL